MCRIFFLIGSMFLVFNTLAQSDANKLVKWPLEIQLYSIHKEPLVGALVWLNEKEHVSESDLEGKVLIDSLPEGTYQIHVEAPHYKTLDTTLQLLGGKSEISLMLQDASEIHKLDEVLIVERSEVQRVRETSYNVNVIDAKPLHNTAQDLNQVLNKSAGIRVREEGGLGSSFNFSLNGFTGKQVKFFLDGIPMDNFGPSLTLNNIPINLAERIEIYKGVLPIWLGADALGGAINIVTSQKLKSYADVSYSFGSFNTHRTSVNAGYTHAKTGWTVNANLFQNYSDNNYWVDVPIYTASATDNGNYLGERRVRRFHDAYRSETVQLETGLLGKAYADKLLFGVILSQSSQEIQTGAQMSRVYGRRVQNSNTLMPTFKYKKSDLFFKGLDLNFYAGYNLGSTLNVDTNYRVYNWAGEYQEKSRDSTGKYVIGAENSRTMYEFRNNLVLANANLSYTINASHSFGFNYTFSGYNRKGQDPQRPNEESLKQPMGLNKHVLGLGYKVDYKKKWSTSLFAKRYVMDANATDRVDIYTNPRWVPIYNDMSRFGYGIATSYFIWSFLQAKASWENTCRLPEGDEMFGDGVNQLPNKNLRPESSNNLNVGATFNHKFQNKHQIVVEGNFIYRDAVDFIRRDVVDMSSRPVNIRGIDNKGFDVDCRYSYKDILQVGGNLTYQLLINTQKYENPSKPVVSDIYLDQIPNIPYLFGNIDFNLRFKKVGFSHARLSFNYAANYVETFYLKWPSLGSAETKSFIPQQWSHNLGLTYTVKEGRYNITVECRNFTDAKLYDNYMLQKPGRAFYVKLRYFIKK